MKILYMHLHERLTFARKQAGYETATEAAEALGVPYPTYAGHENGSSGFRRGSGELYARRFKVRFEWLMTGRGPTTDQSAKYQEILDIYDSLPEHVRATYLDVLRKIAEPYQSKEPDPKEITLSIFHRISMSH